MPVPAPRRTRGASASIPFRRHSTALSAASLAAAALVLAAPAPAEATTGSGTAPGDGWLRLAHLSPDTVPMDLEVTRDSDRSVVLDADDVAYGAFSGYLRLAAGDYSVAFTPSGAPDDADPAFVVPVVVDAGVPVTLAAHGRNAAVTATRFVDDLGAPEPGSGRVRLLQAATTADSVHLRVDGGTLLGDVPAGAASDYRTIPAGPVVLGVIADGQEQSLDVDVTSGEILTVVVLDTADGGITARAIEDGAAATIIPVGGIQTGGGALAAREPASMPGASAFLAGLAVVIGSVGVVLLRANAPRRARARRRVAA